MSKATEETTTSDPPDKNDKSPLLSVENLELVFRTEEGVVEALEGVDFELYPGELLGIIGESGCGKSVTARAVLGLLDRKAEIVNGSIRYDERDLLREGDNAFRAVRGTGITMIFQEPSASLNPVFTVRRQLVETLIENQNLSEEVATDRGVELLESVQLPTPRAILEKYPHQLSGGQQQRVMIALALACDPDILIADEPTTALDVTVQAKILHLLTELTKKFDVSVLLITHNLGVVAQTCDRVSVMYAGSIVETAPTSVLFSDPKHPYSRRLLESIPTLAHRTDTELPTIPGVVPDLMNPPSGCRFRTRCDELLAPDVAGLSAEAWDAVIDLAHHLEDGRPVEQPHKWFEHLHLGELSDEIGIVVDLLTSGNDETAYKHLQRVLSHSPCASARPSQLQVDESSTRCFLYGGELE